jgi:hypothetical protein
MAFATEHSAEKHEQQHILVDVVQGLGLDTKQQPKRILLPFRTSHIFSITTIATTVHSI